MTNKTLQEKKLQIYHFNLIGGLISPFFYTFMKRLKVGEEFPDDFWNYNVNPITGYYIEPNRNEINENVVRKYATTPKAI